MMMWEVLTLGQQPYPARTNIEVLHYEMPKVIALFGVAYTFRFHIVLII